MRVNECHGETNKKWSGECYLETREESPCPRG
jgi:hypothetical protein